MIAKQWNKFICAGMYITAPFAIKTKLCLGIGDGDCHFVNLWPHRTASIGQKVREYVRVAFNPKFSFHSEGRLIPPPPLTPSRHFLTMSHSLVSTSQDSALTSLSREELLRRTAEYNAEMGQKILKVVRDHCMGYHLCFLGGARQGNRVGT